MGAYAVVGCSRCGSKWSVETRYATSRCPACGQSVDLRRRTRLWQGDDADEARRAAAALRAGEQVTLAPEPVPRHDDPVQAAAAKARAVVNQSARADAVALWLTRLLGTVPETTYFDALQQAGLSRDRAAREITRMLACDVIFEPVAGSYQTLER